MALLLSLSLVACSGGTNNTSSGASIQSAPDVQQPVIPNIQAPTTIQVTYDMPRTGFTTSGQTFQRRLEYISSANLSLSVVVTPLGGSPMSPVVGSCTTVSCSVSFTANPGPTTLAFTLTDTSGGGGTTLSTFSTFKIVQPGILNTIALTANPIVNSVNVQLTSTTTPAGTPTTIPVTVNALDPDGKTIVGSGNYVDASGNPLALLLTTSDSQNGGSGSVTLRGPMRITAPNQPAISAYYDGGWLNSASITVSSTKSLLGSLSGVTVSTTPKIVHEYAIPTTAALARTITTGPDGNLWFSEQNGNRIGRFNVSTSSISEFATPTNPSGPIGITVGADGNLWFVESGAPKLGKITTNGTITEYTVPSGSFDQNITAGPDGNLWFTEGNPSLITKSTVNGKMTEYPTPTASAFPYGITAGSDGNLWFVEQNANNVGRVTVNGKMTEYSIPTSNAQPQGITAGPDGNLWFAEFNGNNIGRITPSGTITEFGIPTSNSQPQVIAPGPDGCLYFVETNGDNIGRITTSGTITEYAVPTSGAIPAGIVTGPDGMMWFTEYSGDNIGRFIF